MYDKVLFQERPSGGKGFTAPGVVMLCLFSWREGGDGRSLAGQLAELEQIVASQDGHIKTLFDVIRQLMEPPPSRSRRAGFNAWEEGPDLLKNKACS